jgi:hypothetical protein
MISKRLPASLSSWAVALVLVASAAALSACAGGSPASPDAAGVVVKGTLLGVAASAPVRAASATNASAAITVTVLENPAITTTVGADGSFTLRGLPPGSFTLVFTSGATELGRVVFAEVKPNQEITVTVASTGGTITVVEEHRDGIGHGDVEIEGNVTQIIVLSLTGDSRFLINGKTVVTRPGQTAVREGNRSRTVEDITLGRHVHVKGVWLPTEATLQPVLAQEVILQDGELLPSPSPSPAASRCFAAGEKAEVEGNITAKGGSSITVHQQGKGDYEAQVSAGTRIRKGNTSFTFAQLAVGWRVHVSGSGLGESGSTCLVSADEIKVQQP